MCPITRALKAQPSVGKCDKNFDHNWNESTVTTVWILTAMSSIIGCRGFPYWLKDIPGIVFRTDNEPFKVMNSSILFGTSREFSFS